MFCYVFFFVCYIIEYTEGDVGIAVPVHEYFDWWSNTE